jgi:hypothetical protein
MLNISSWYIDKTGTVSGYIQAGRSSHDFSPFMTDGETILQHSNFAGKAGKCCDREHRQDCYA